MAEVAGTDPRLNMALKTFLSNWKGARSARLSLESDNGDLTVILELKIGHFSEKHEPDKGHQNSQRRRVGPSQVRRRERRSADKAVQLRAAKHVAPAALTPSPKPAAEEAEAPAEEATTQVEEATTQAAAQANQAAATPAPASESNCPTTRCCTSCGQPCCGHYGPTLV